jgi:uncharacterized protein YfaS (alpha-2-macroglobulin family)
MGELEKSHPKATKVAWGLIALGGLATLWSMGAGASGHAVLIPLGIKLVAPHGFLSDSPGAVRVIVTDHAHREPASGASVSLRLTNEEGTQGHVLFEGRTDRAGTVNAAFKLPDLPPGSYVLRAEARHGTQRDEVSERVQVRRAYQLMLVTDKPMYQPNQTIHMRALVLRRPDMRPVADQQVTFEVRDGKGNKVFKRTVQTSRFGAAWAAFDLADEVNMGRYECKVLFADTEAVKTVEVKRYVLPKFKVTVDTERSYYMPGMQLSGTVTAEYFFGKPVAGGKVEVAAKTFDVEYKEIARVEGKTDAKGSFDFQLSLPRHFVGQPLQQGQAFVELDVKVTDTADHTEKVVISRTVTAQDLQIRAVSESGELVPNVPNTVWVLVSDPTGKTVKALVELRDVTAEAGQVKWQKQTVSTDDLGVAEITITPQLKPSQLGLGGAALSTLRRKAMPPGEIFEPQVAKEISQQQAPVTLLLAARTHSGQSAEARVPLALRQLADGESLLLRTNKAVGRVGEEVKLTALSPVSTGYVYFDVIKDRQTMLTQAADLRSGRASASITLGPELVGTVYVSAYRITRRGEIVRDTRPLVVEPASGLNIDVRASRDAYKPGEQARLDFRVKTGDGRPTAAALGVSIVDESVFALQEMQPGMERVYAYLEEQLRKPRYEIHGLEMPVIIARPEPLAQPHAQRAAQVMLASAELPELEISVKDSYLERLERAKSEWAEKMESKLTIVERALEAYRHKHRQVPTYEQGLDVLVREGFLKENDIKDLWGNPMKAVPSWEGEDRMYAAMLLSAGPDGEFDTEDDVLIGPDRRRVVFGPGIRMRGAGGMVLLEAAPEAAAMGAPKAAVEGQAGAGPQAAQPLRVRQFFPETLLFRPDLITDDNGQASLEFNMADSITTWRMTALANSAQGDLGSRDAPLRCFQDFFVDLDLPVSLTQGDEVSLPVAVYNYLKTPQTVRLKLEKADWFELSGPAEQNLDLQANEVTVRYFPIKATGLGDHKLTVFAYGTQMSDAISRSIRVEPNGKMVAETANGRLKGDVAVELTIPDQAIEGASTILVKVYPGIFSQAVEGLDSILQMPFGCFEQTTSVTYPNVLVLDYMRTTRQVTPEIQMKAEEYINLGYQRLVSYEVPGGGFSWFGNPPANKLLTALGVMEFYDMSQVFPVDEAVIRRTQAWLLSQQEPDGSFKPDEEYLHHETWQRLQNNRLMPTAYVTWSLASTGEDRPETKSGWEYVRSHWKEASGPYQLAIVCNALVAGDNLFRKGDLDDITLEALDKLVGMAKRKGEQMWWEGEISGITHSSGESADLETTGFAALALIGSGRYASEAAQVLNYLVAAKDDRGTWHSTQATMLALKALLLAQKGATQKAKGQVEVVVNGRSATTFDITPENSDVLQMVDCRHLVRTGKNTIKLAMKGEGSMLYQVVAKYWLPWKLVREDREEFLDITVDYDKTKLSVDDLVTARARIKNDAPGATSMVVVDLGIPPGFTVEAGDLAELVDQNVINKFSITGRQITVYLEKIGAGQEISFSYRLRARYPIRAQAPASSAYEYYNPDNRAEAKPVEVTVTD